MAVNMLVISDSHRDTAAVRKLLSIYAREVNIVVHLGDEVSDLLMFEREFPKPEIHVVPGNCDYATNLAQEKIITVNGCKILLAHGHAHNVKMSCDRIAYYAQEKEVNACFFGHTHRPDYFTVGPVRFFNPGSLSRPFPGFNPSYGLASITDDGCISCTILNVAG